MKDMVLQDLPDPHPGSTRAGVEQVLLTFDESPTSAGDGMASQLAITAPAIATRLASCAGRDLHADAEMMRGAAVLVLQMWTANDQPPSVGAIIAGVEALEEPV